ncbi:MAG: helix-turn-helix domain-containing protein [Proteobacteria bacterium]|nr:helix-turn-helix domain-containing protein [Pseudomonadota bacterium]
MTQLDQLIEGLEVGVSAFAICEVRQDAKFILKEETNTAVHYVLSGEGVAWQSGGRKFPLKPHTIMIIPPGSLVAVSNEQGADIQPSDADCEPLPQDWDSLTIGNGAPGIKLVCGFIRAMHLETTGLFDHLSEPLVVDVSDDTSFRAPFRQLLDELAAPKLGTRVLAEMLMKQCLIVLLRRQTETARDNYAPWIAAAGHPELGRALAAITDKPEADHTLQGLADIAGMSRTTFAEQFRRAFDRTPMDLVKEVRLRRAARFLAATNLPVKAIAFRVGYSSRSHFSRAFKSMMGADPVSYRSSAAVTASLGSAVVHTI